MKAHIADLELKLLLLHILVHYAFQKEQFRFEGGGWTGWHFETFKASFRGCTHNCGVDGAVVGPEDGLNHLGVHVGEHHLPDRERVQRFQSEFQDDRVSNNFRHIV